MKKSTIKPLSSSSGLAHPGLAHSNRGFTLLEVLISMVVLAVGLLGVSGLQVTGLRSNHSSLMRTQATLYTSDMADRMRANSTGFNAGDYDIPAAVAKADCGTTTGCTPQEMADNDMSVWSAEIGNTLPSGTGMVCIDSTPLDGASGSSPACDGVGSSYAIKIWWQDERGSTTPSLKRFVVTYL